LSFKQCGSHGDVVRVGFTVAMPMVFGLTLTLLTLLFFYFFSALRVTFTG